MLVAINEPLSTRSIRVAVVNPNRRSISGGYKKYLERVIPYIERDPRIGSLQVFADTHILDELDLESSTLVRWPSGRNSVAMDWLRTQVLKGKPDVVFVPTAVPLCFGNAPILIMVHNMEPLTVPLEGNNPREAVKNLARAVVARRACQRASRIIAVSEHVRGFLTERWRIAKSKIGVVYHGADLPIERVSQTRPSSLRTTEPGSFLFTAGSIRPARGLGDLILAMADKKLSNKSLRLVIAGRAEPTMVNYERRLRSEDRRLGVDDRIIWAGQLDSQQMGWCYQNCFAFVMTSRAEACPNTALEALSYGCRIISTTKDPMPEFFIDNARYYVPRSASDLAKQILEAMTVPDETGRPPYADALQRASFFRWSDTASQAVEQMQLCVDGDRK